MAELRRRTEKLVSDEVPFTGKSQDLGFKGHVPKNPRNSSWIFAVTVSFLGAVLLYAFIKLHSVPPPKLSSESHLGEFSEQRARVHLDKIASYGPRPTGSIANEVHAVNYILKQVSDIKSSAKKSVRIDIDVQRPSGTFFLGFLDGFTSHYYNVTNIVVRLSPEENFPPKHTVLVNAHFDSVPYSPGASDDAVSCATMLEVLRVMSQCPEVNFTYGVIFLFNGAEENILQASHGFISQHPWAQSVRAFVNLEAAGAGGKEVVFQTGPEHPWLIKTYTEVAPYPSAQVLGQEIFQSGLIPSDTDFRIFRDYGHIPGIDIAYITNGFVYHTQYDTPAAITKGSIQRAGENVFSVVKEIANSPLLEDPGEYRHGAMVFFDFLGLLMIHYPERIGVIVNGLTLVITVLCVLQKFLSSQKAYGEEKVSLSPACLLSSLLGLVLSWIAAIMFPVLVGVVLTACGRPLTWFCRPYLVIGLFVAPSLLGLGSVHYVSRTWIISKKDRPPSCPTILPDLVKRESDTFYASLVIWTSLLGVLTYYDLASAHLPLSWVLFPLAGRVVIWESFLQKHKLSSRNTWQFMTAYLSSVVVPVAFTSYAFILITDLFLPIMGRSGSETVPDIFIAGLAAMGVVIVTSYLVSLVYLIEDFKWPALFLASIAALSIGVSLAGLSFPFSAEKQCPKRVFYQHIVRTFHDAEGKVVKSDSGVWLNPLDFTGITHLQHLPLMQTAKQVTSDDGVYEGFPYYIPARNLFKKAWFIPGPSPDVNSLLWDVKLVSRTRRDDVIRFTYSITGPDHMTVYFSPANGVDLFTSSLGDMKPTADLSETSRTTYFLYYSHGTRSEPWEFWVEFEVDKQLPKGSHILDLAVAAHYLNKPWSETPFLSELLRQTPDWVFSISWVNIYQSWAYDL
ncbi:endoplasmic reticulum metallopeptidase 1 [Nematostella vectensis]|uniref:endoplasmic reticulum metallopeptidase 1 n=1 Tax=Nematostella vectensis TaxID=45351 RepID=UPI0020771615|nr:endoplasmic reticulum metallopeptidase 1 [Nematostella vectensis]